MSMHGKESCCVVFISDQVKPYVGKLETISFETVLSTTIVRVNNALDVCHHACSVERFVIAVYSTEE